MRANSRDELQAEYESLKSARRRESAEIVAGLRRDFNGTVKEWREHFDAAWKVWTPVNTFKYAAIGEANRSDVFVIVSSSADPNAVVENARRGEEARRALGELGDVIPSPIRFGVVDGRSYAVFPHYRPFRFRGRPRFLGDLQRLMLVRRALPWFRAATKRTADEPTPEERQDLFIAPLRRLGDTPDVPNKTRAAAEMALGRLEKGAWSPLLSFTHDDSGFGNFLKPNGRPASKYPIIIDWERSLVRGYGFYDIIGMSSARLCARRVRAELERHRQILDCDPRDIRNYLLAVLAGKFQALRVPLPEPLWKHPEQSVRDDIMGGAPADQRKTIVDVAGAVSRLKQFDRLKKLA